MKPAPAVLAGAVALTALALLPNESRAQYVPPAGYTKTPLLTAANQPLNAAGIGVSGGGRLAIADGSTITLYNTWQNGRTVIGSITDSADWSFLTDITFIGENKIIVGENGKSKTAWSIDFTTPATPVAAKIAPSNSFPAIQDLALLNFTTALVSGSTASQGASGGLYLDKLNLTNGNISPVVSNAGSGFVGATGVTPAGSGVLLDTGVTTGIAHIYDSTNGTFVRDVSFAGGGGTGAYGLAFDPAGDAFVTTGATLTEITGIDSANPAVTTFGSFSEGAAGFPFPTGIAFTGDSFRPDDSAQTGVLLVNGDFTNDGTVFAITSVPEPASAGFLLLAGVALVGQRRAKRGGDDV
ncbi:MAG TPA: hypothetical protein VLI90_01805 [Tepidisphaeraceae bacterium]|nr:hypothetical protein [Tepidisphaeraceae bacterium]